MHHQVQQLGNLGLEGLGFGGGVSGRHFVGSKDDDDDDDGENIDIAGSFSGSSFAAICIRQRRRDADATSEQPF
jgi:hypothetical protein